MIDPYLQELKDKFIADLKILLQNKDKKDAKTLQAASEKLYAKFNEDVNTYHKQAVKELETKLAQQEAATLEDLISQLNQL